MFSRLLLKRWYLPVKVKGPMSASLRVSSPWPVWSTLFTPRSETAGDPLFLLCILRARSWWRPSLSGAWLAILLLYLLSSAFRCSVLLYLTDYRGRNKIPQIIFRLMRKDMFLSDPGLSQKVQLSFPENLCEDLGGSPVGYGDSYTVPAFGTLTGQSREAGPRQHSAMMLRVGQWDCSVGPLRLSGVGMSSPPKPLKHVSTLFRRRGWDCPVIWLSLLLGSLESVAFPGFSLHWGARGWDVFPGGFGFNSFPLMFSEG